MNEWKYVNENETEWEYPLKLDSDAVKQEARLLREHYGQDVPDVMAPAEWEAWLNGQELDETVQTWEWFRKNFNGWRLVFTYLDPIGELDDEYSFIGTIGEKDMLEHHLDFYEWLMQYPNSAEILKDAIEDGSASISDPTQEEITDFREWQEGDTDDLATYRGTIVYNFQS